MNGPIKRQGALSIFGYTDFRTYLRAFYAFKKESTRGYSYRAFSKAAGFTSPNVLKLVMDGERNIGTDALAKFVKALGLNGEAADYFKTLVALNQSPKDTEKQQLFEKLRSLTPHANRRDLAAEELKYLSHWLFPVIREMVTLPDFSEDPHWISRRLNGKSSPNEVSAALLFLITSGFLSRDDAGRLTATDSLVISSDEVGSLAIRNYHRQMMDQARETLESLPMNLREFGALTILVPELAMEELKQKMKTFRRELHNWALEATTQALPDTIVQVNFQMYPHTKRMVSA